MAAMSTEKGMEGHIARASKEEQEILRPLVRNVIEAVHTGGNKTVKSFGKVGRNASCPCGSGKKYKKCCGR